MSKLSLTVDVVCGTDIKDACIEAIKLASRIGITVNFEFNDKQILVFPYTDLDSLILAYKEAQENNSEFVCTLDKDKYLRVL